MKRKFSFNLAPVKVAPAPAPSKPEPKATPEPTPSRPAHRRHQSKDSISSLMNTAYISRRPLDPKTEQELRAACALILQDFKPSDHVFTEEAKRTLEYVNGPRKPAKNSATLVEVRRPTGAPADLRHAHDARKHAHKLDTSGKTYPDLPIQANTGRRRTENTEEMGHEFRTHVKSPTADAFKPVVLRNEIGSDDGTSVRTPQTASTDHHFNDASTAPTSAALTSSRSSKRASRQLDSAAAVADAQAAEWMRQELEKRKQQLASQPQPEQKNSRPPTRSRSIRSDIKEYIFPGSSERLSRAQSRESMRSGSISSQNESKRSGSASGWRSWGLQRKSSSRSSSRPGTSKGRIETQEQDKKQELNLNRELPPLPSLDSWNKQDQSKKENRKSQTQGAHIASLMRPQDQQQEYAAAVRRHHRRSGSDTLALKYANSHNQSSPQVARSTSQMKVHAHVIHAQKHDRKLETATDFDEMMSAMDSSSKDFDDQLRLRVAGHNHQQSGSSVSHPASAKVSLDHTRLGAAPNFSRKISTEVIRSPRIDEDFPFENVIQITPNSETMPKKEENKSKLRKAISGWRLKKDKKENWMDQFEKNGIKAGVMIQDEAAAPPIIRY